MVSQERLPGLFLGEPDLRNLIVDARVSMGDFDEHGYAASLFCSELFPTVLWCELGGSWKLSTLKQGSVMCPRV